MLTWIKHNLVLGLCYIALSLIIGECHPFSLVPMYDSFPKMACTFYLSGSDGKLMPLQRYFNYKTADLTHNYYAVCESKKINGGNATETPQQLIETGKTMMGLLTLRQIKPMAGRHIQLHQVYYFLKGDSIGSNDKVMYEFENN